MSGFTVSGAQNTNEYFHIQCVTKITKTGYNSPYLP